MLNNIVSIRENNLGALSNQSVSNVLVPSVKKRTIDGMVETYDIYSRLLDDRIIMVTGEIETHMANVIISELLYLDSIDKEKPIYMYIDSPGGMCVAGFGIIDTMHNISAPVHTTCLGFAASMGAMILCQGDHRSALPHSEILIHQPLGGAQGQATDIQIAAKSIQKTKETLLKMIADSTKGKTPLKQVKKDCERDHALTAQEALDYGLIDEIQQPKSK